MGGRGGGGWGGKRRGGGYAWLDSGGLMGGCGCYWEYVVHEKRLWASKCGRTLYISKS